MSTILTQEAAEGFDAPQGAECPYYHSSPAGMAWHLGQHLACTGGTRPTPDAAIKDAGRVAVTMGRGDTLNIRGRCDTLISRYRWRDGNRFSEVRQ